MNPESRTLEKPLRRLVMIHLLCLAGIAIVLIIAHVFLDSVRTGRIYWFNLDKERNISTWFSSILFFLFGVISLAGYHMERHLSDHHKTGFRLSWLWIVIGLTGFALSLDEATILHENLYWKEIRIVSGRIDPAWIFMTQWQILFAPLIVLLLSLIAVFFLNRFSISRTAGRCFSIAFPAWIVALILEGARYTFKEFGKTCYDCLMCLEEGLEMFGTIFFIAAIAYYILDIRFRMKTDPESMLKEVSRFWNRRILLSLSLLILLLFLSGFGLYLLGKRQAALNRPLPRLYRSVQQISRSAAPSVKD